MWTTTANQFLPPEVEGLTVGKALDLACGEGCSAAWLATQGWEATGVDFSSSGLAKAAALAVAASALAPAGTLVVVGHDLTNLTDGVGGPPDPAVLYSPGDVVADLLASTVW